MKRASRWKDRSGLGYWLTGLLLGGLLGAPAALAESRWHSLLEQADEARGNLEGVTWNVDLLSKEKGRESALGFEVRARAFDILAEHVSPPREKGKKLVMILGNMWFYKPGLRKPVPISRRQKLMGNAAYGDIAATNYAEDYEVVRASDGTARGRPCQLLELKSKDTKTTYDRIDYCVDEDRQVGLRAEYYTVSGKKFKTAKMEYAHRVVRDGTPQPFISRMTIYDELLSDDVTILTFGDPTLEPIPDRVFNLNLLGR